jgi:hypothetical protein
LQIALDFSVDISYLDGINKQEVPMKKNNEARFTEKLKQYGFKKKETGEKGFHMWEMSPADLRPKKEEKK